MKMSIEYYKLKRALFAFPINALLLPDSKISYSELCSKFLDKPGKTGFVVLSFGKSNSKTGFYLDFLSLIRNFAYAENM